MRTVSELISLVKTLPEQAIDHLFEVASQQQSAVHAALRPCPYCGSEHVIRYGKKCGKQRFLCKSCERTFVTTTHTIMSNSHQGISVWKDVIADTFDGVSIDRTAERLALSHQSVFDMSHKILVALGDIEDSVLGGVSELDETYVLDSYKGKKLPENVTRSSRKHGAKAQKRGISNEYLCICTGVQRSGKAVAVTVNRAKPTVQELEEAFENRLDKGALLLCDGLRGYTKLGASADCAVKDINTAEAHEKKFYNLNLVNNFHSFLKHRYEAYRGVATKYLNRYNTLFSAAYRCTAQTVSACCDALLSVGRQDLFHSIMDVKVDGLLDL
jgi:transposase-like protein